MREHLQRLIDELARHRLEPEITRTGSTHFKFTWQAPNAAPRQLFAANSPSDWRGTINNVAMIRRMCREDGVIPTDKQKPLRERIQTHKQGKISVGPILAAIEALTKQVEELFDYITDPSAALTAEPKPVVAPPKRQSATRFLQFLDFQEWRPAATVALSANEPYANVMAGLKSLEQKKLAVNYPRVGWRRTPVEAVRVEPTVIEAAPPKLKKPARVAASVTTTKPAMKKRGNGHTTNGHSKNPPKMILRKRSTRNGAIAH